MDDVKFSILIVDDNTQNIQVLADVLEGCGYETGFAMSGKQAVDYVLVEKPDLILLDVMMPEMDGYEACQIIKSYKEFADIPIIFLTAKIEVEDIVKGFEVGGVDYILKPFNSCELKSRVKTHLELKKIQDDLKKSYEMLKVKSDLIESQNQQLNEIMCKLEILSKTDPLTGLYNRRSMISAMEQKLAEYNPSNPFSIVMADIDHFKIVNDTFGHGAGDKVLTLVSSIINDSVNDVDIVSRWGGEEFLLLINKPAEQAYIITENIRNKILNSNIDLDGFGRKLSMTFGISEYKSEDTVDELIKRADNALYEGKKTGRNKTVKF